MTYQKALSFLDIQILVLSCQLNKISLELYIPITFSSELSMKCSRVVGVTPSVVYQKGVDHFQLQELVEMYHGDLPSPELVEQEVMRCMVT